MKKAKYYNFPDEDYYALIKAESKEKAKEIYAAQVAGDDVSEIYEPQEISEVEARKQWDEAEDYWNEIQNMKDVMPQDEKFEDAKLNSLLLIDSSFA